MRIRRAAVPIFALYGERAGPLSLHIEGIQDRSRRYRGEIAPHRHRSLCQCLYVRSGPVAVHLEDMRQHLRGPVLVIVPPGAIHGFQMGEDTSGHVLTIAPDELLLPVSGAIPRRVEEFLQIPRIIDLQGSEESAVRLDRLFCLLQDEFRRRDSASSALPAMLAAALVSLIASHPAQEPSLRGSRSEFAVLRRFHGLIESHLAAHWSVPRYAHAIGLTESALNRLCRRQLGNSALAVIQQRLALEARRRLIYMAAPVARIGADLGFRDPAYFCRFFRRHTGHSPRDYRKQLQ